MSGKVILVALVLILIASGTSIALQAAGGRVESPAARQLTSGTPAPLQTEDVGATPEATNLVMTPDFTDCLPVEATPESTVAATEEATPISTFVPTPDCFPATPDVAFTPEATPDDFIATLDATDDDDGGQGRGRGRGRGDDDDEGDDDSGQGRGRGRGGDDD